MRVCLGVRFAHKAVIFGGPIWAVNQDAINGLAHFRPKSLLAMACWLHAASIVAVTVVIAGSTLTAYENRVFIRVHAPICLFTLE